MCRRSAGFAVLVRLKLSMIAKRLTVIDRRG